jgi:hypothetical protein
MTYNFVTRVKHVTSEAGTACPSGAPEFTQESKLEAQLVIYTRLGSSKFPVSEKNL